MVISIHQPRYLPWLGFFHKVASSDIFVILDTVQFSKGSFQNRCQIKQSQGVNWLTVPVILKGQLEREIRDIKIYNGINWWNKHYKTLEWAYKRASYWCNYEPFLQELYLEERWDYLSELNIYLLFWMFDELGIKSKVIRASKLEVVGKKGDLILNICKRVGADIYLSGIGARYYLDEGKFVKNGIRVVWQDFKHPGYPQLWGDFKQGLSAMDLLLNCGKDCYDILMNCQKQTRDTIINELK